MAYDIALAERVRQIILDEFGELVVDLTEVAMFGGLAFLIRGNMAVAVGSGGEMMLRCDRDDIETHLAAGADQTVMGTRVMRGWLDVSGEQTADDARLTAWVLEGVRYAATLPAKR